MGLVILFYFICLFEKSIKRNTKRTRVYLHLVLIGFVIFSIILNNYLENVYGWQYGVPGADLSAHFNGAKALSEGYSISNLYNIAYRFEMSVSGIPYIAYAYFLKLVAFTPVIISYRFSLHIFYTIQLIVAVLSVDNVCHLFANSKKKYNYTLLLIISACVCILQQASILMRDIWVFYFLSLYFSFDFTNKKNRVKIILTLIICTLLRSYTVILTLPYLIWKITKKIKLGVIVSILTMSVFAFGQTIIGNLAANYGVRWEFSFNYDAVAILRYILFPNIITQTYNVQHPATGMHANFGGNTEWIYYMLSCWNTYVYPLAGYGMYRVFTKVNKIEEGLIWLFQIVNIGLLYSVFYNSESEPRHKLLILFGLLFFCNEATNEIKKKYILIYTLLIVLFEIVLFAFVG